jgi:NarL family two-component system response regulator YdfI
MALTAEAEPRSATPIRVFLIDEELVVRAGMRILIDSWPISRVVGEADATEAMTAMEAVKPDLIVFSHNGHSTESLDSLSDLIRAAGQVPLVLLTSSRDPDLGAAAVQAGARGIILKQYAASELRTAIERAHSGEVWTNNSTLRTRMAQKYREERRNEPDGDDGSLTTRERQVAVLVSKGCTNRQVGRNLGITEVTVRHHLTSIFNKLGIANRFELIAWLYRRGIVNPEKMA